MAGTQNGPIPTHLTLLSDLPSFKPHSKVRFLGCVMEYCTKKADLVLEHNHPVGNSLRAHVDVTLLLHSIKSNETRVGEWVNVMGYVKSERNKEAICARTLEVYVQAIVLWSAGPLDLEGYEKSLRPKSEDTDVT